jgi:transposase
LAAGRVWRRLSLLWPFTEVVIRCPERGAARAHARLAEHVDYQLLRKIPGIGRINALTILAEAGDLRHSNHHRQCLKFCGLDLATCQSGIPVTPARISRDATLKFP